MFFKVVVPVLLFLSILATATQTVSYDPLKPTPEPIPQCNTGDAQCCNSATSATNPAAAAVLGLLGVGVQGVDILVGLGCTLITIMQVEHGVEKVPTALSSPCAAKTTISTALRINIGCTPISH
ncbi:hypothetical protein M422DRAFT_258546 [Sphaerobolus stellatus SS14]|uniref:Hydrophobin n=1 Tax=Sphaerobolus stellatus (strain SS14) TaxID=990650 RepID=A0A0C9U6M5_SPHS4|nr:hypothetical protein M422DRAFT_258546 [Sphaerobolus stellatus SS14]